MMTVLEVVNLFNVSDFVYHTDYFEYNVNVNEAHNSLLNRKHISYFVKDGKLHIIQTA